MAWNHSGSAVVGKVEGGLKSRAVRGYTALPRCVRGSLFRASGGIGRRWGLKIPFRGTGVRVRIPSRLPLRPGCEKSRPEVHLCSAFTKTPAGALWGVRFAGRAIRRKTACSVGCRRYSSWQYLLLLMYSVVHAESSRVPWGGSVFLSIAYRARLPRSRVGEGSHCKESRSSRR